MIQLLLSPSQSPIPYGIAILALMLFACFFVFLGLIIKIKTRDSFRARGGTWEQPEADKNARSNDAKASSLVENPGTAKGEKER